MKSPDERIPVIGIITVGSLRPYIILANSINPQQVYASSMLSKAPCSKVWVVLSTNPIINVFLAPNRLIETSTQGPDSVKALNFAA